MTQSTKRRKLSVLMAAVAGIALTATGCGSGGNTQSESGSGSSSSGSEETGASDKALIVFAGSQTPIQANFNPYSPGLLHATQGPIYESLMLFNRASVDPPTPILATEYEWNEDGTQMTVKLREGVKWSDGEDFTPDDVVYSFMNELIKASYLESAEATDDQTVVFHFNEPAFVNESSILGTLIVPEHIFGQKSADELLEWANEDPVGTGPFTVASVSDAVYTLAANPDYWGGEPELKSVRYLGIDGNSSGEDLVRSGDLHWVSMFVPDPSSIDTGYINNPLNPTVLYTCSNADLGCEGPQTDVAVRQAISAAIDRSVINEKAFVGLTKEISPTFALLGRDDAWITEGMPAEIDQTADVDGAKKILEDAGWTLGSDGIYEKDGEKLSLTLTSVDGWTDYNDTGKLIEEQTKAAGIEVVASTVSWQEYSDSRQAGEFELVIGGMDGTPVADPFMLYRDWFTTEKTSPVGQQLPVSSWGIARYSNPDVDAAVLASSQTNDTDERLAQYAIVQENIVRDLPYIPININATQTFFDDKNFTGWPTEDNLYAYPPSWSSSAGLILSKLVPVN
ncbi:MAG: ABC transporter substrate-binding protein [Scrofimicrobium sp.]